MDFLLLRGIYLLFVFQLSAGQSTITGHPCLPENRLDKESACLRHITDLLFDENSFFFGKTLDSSCDAAARNNSDDLTCFVDDPSTRRYSLASRLFNSNIRPETVDRYLTVTFNTLPGRYKACGVEGFPIEARTTDASPDMNPSPAVYVRNSPKFDMRTEKNTFYTIIVIDATFGYIHGLILDYPATKDVLPFTPPLNYRNITNTFVFVVYRQPERDYMLQPRTQFLIKNPKLAKQFDLNDFATTHGLVGPVALNWMAVTSDPYAVQQVADRFGENYCIRFMTEAFSGLSFARQLDQPVEDMGQISRPFDITKLDLSFNVSFPIPYMDFTVCCSPTKISAYNLPLNPIMPSGQVMDNELARTHPVIAMQRNAFSLPDAESARYVVIAVNPDAPELGTLEKPYLVWIAWPLTEDPNSRGNFKQPFIDSLFPYKLPAMQYSAQPQKLFFLLFEQTSHKNELNPGYDTNANSSDQCPARFDAEYKGRCFFNLKQFAARSHLVLRGVNWITVKSESVTRFNAVVKGGIPEASVCEKQAGYSTRRCSPAVAVTTVAPPASAAVGLLVSSSYWLYLLAVVWLFLTA